MAVINKDKPQLKTNTNFQQGRETINGQTRIRGRTDGQRDRPCCETDLQNF